MLAVSAAAALAATVLLPASASATTVTVRGVIGFGPSTPVAGVVVRTWGSAAYAVTAADGSYALSVPTGSTTLELSGRYLGSDFTGSSDAFTVSADRTEDITLPLPTRLAATIDESDGTPAVGALVHRPLVAATGASSSGVPVSYSLSDGYCQVSDNGWCDLSFFAGYLPFLEITGPGRSTEIFPGETFPVGTVSRTYTLKPSAVVGGVLRRADGQPAADADVWWRPGSSIHTRTGADGTWLIRMSGGSGQLQVSGDDLDGVHQEPYEFDSDTFDVTASRTEDLTLPALAHLVTTVRDSVGHEVAGARVATVGDASVMGGRTSSGLGGTFHLRRSGASCQTQPGSGACELPVFRGGSTAQVTVTPPGASAQLFPVGATPDDVNAATLRLRGYATLTSAGSSSGPVLVTTSASTADFTAMATSRADLPDGLDPMVGRLDYQVAVPTGGATSLEVVLPATASPNDLLHVGTDGRLTDVAGGATLGGNQVELPVADGGAGDEDGVANGVITGNVVPVRRAGLVVETTSLPPAAAGKAYTARLAGSGPVAPYSWRALDPLPPGLTLGPDGLISGTPSTVGTWTFDVMMTESTGSRFSAVRTLSLTVATVVVATSALPDAYLGGSYSSTLTRLGGGWFATWHVVSGALPPGITLSSGGVLSGRPTSLGTYRFAVAVSSGGKASPSQVLTLVVRPMEVATSSLPDGTAGRWYSQPLTTHGGKGTLTWSLASGSLPPKLTLGSGGRIYGTPNTLGTWTFTVRVTDSSSPKQQAVQTLTLTIG
jgi:hypothetical protein